MTVKEYDALKQKIERAKTAKARAEGAKEKIEQQFSEQFDMNIEDAESLLNTIKTNNEALQARKEKLVAKLDTLCDWEEI